MKTKLIQLRNSKGEYVGAYRKSTRFIVSMLVGLCIATFVAHGVRATENDGRSTGNAEVVGSSDQRLDLGDTTGSSDTSTVGILVDGVWNFTDRETLIKALNVTKWYTAQDIEKERLVGVYVKKYPYASPSVISDVLDVAFKEGFGRIDYLMALIACESKFNPLNTNSKGNTPAGSVDRGLLQFSNYWQAKVSDKCSFDATCATRTAVEYLKAGRDSLWVCSNLVKK